MSIKATSNSLNYFASYCCVKHCNQKQLGEEWFHFIWQLTVHYEGKEGRNSNRAGTEAETMEEGCLWSCSSQCAQLSIFFYYSDLSFKHIDVIYSFIYLFIYLFFSCLQNMYMLFPKQPPEGSRFPETGTTNDLEPPCGFWKLKPGPLEERPVLTIEPSLHPLI